MKAAICATGVLAGIFLLSEPSSSTDLRKLEGTWELVKTGDQVLPATAQRLPSFTVSHRMISGFDGCNRFGGPLDQPQKIALGQRGCSGEFVKLPLDLLDPARHLRAGRVEGNRLYLPARAGLPTSEFRRR